jgi:phosphotransferase system HPr-like phosphotransfer protein
VTVRLLLINPRFDESFWSFRWALEEILPAKRAVNPPLGLATLAALCPPHWTVGIVDENIESVPLAPRADVIGVCGMAAQFERQAGLDHAFFTRAARPLAKLLRRTSATVTLAIEEIQAGQARQFRRLLAKLARYGDRVVIEAGERARQVLAVDSSIFRLALPALPRHS